MLKQRFKKIIESEKHSGSVNSFIKNKLKEHLQLIVLEYIYNSLWKKLIFTGGSCLRLCYNLDRLSEDLDFDFFQKDFLEFPNTEKLSNELVALFKKNYNLKNLEVSSKKTRIYLKFPILQELQLASLSESNKLYLKIELPNSSGKEGKTVFNTITQNQFAILLKTYDLQSLMAGKINAIFKRVWFKEKDDIIDIKGRDFYDLVWFFEKRIIPNWKKINSDLKINDIASLFNQLEIKIKKVVTYEKLRYDLINFVKNKSFVENFCRNYFEIFTNYKNIYLNFPTL